MTVRIAIVGDGISGLTAAFRARQQLGAGAEIDVFADGERPGGLLRTVEVGGAMVDVGAEAFIVRRPEALALVTELGLADRVVSPAGLRPAIWSGDALHPLPAPALMGIPADADALRGLADPADLARVDTEPDRPMSWVPGTDVSVGELVGDRFGPSVVARSVDPMLGGVYSSLAADIGVREAIPALAAQLDGGAPSLSAAVGELIAGNRGAGPVFGTLLGGYQVLIDALRDAAGARLRPCSHVTEVVTEGGRWTVLTGRRPATDDPIYDGVILAVPAWSAGRILRHAAPDIAPSLESVEGASSVVVSLAFEPGTVLPQHSGVLVATGEQLHAKAFTLSSRKWAHLDHPDRPVSVRASFGRYGAAIPDECAEPGIDADLRRWAVDEFDRVCVAAGVRAPSARVIDTYLQRWTRGLPRYAPGHLARMAEVIAQRPPRLALAGSSYAGVGVPACIGQATRAVTDLLADLG